MWHYKGKRDSVFLATKCGRYDEDKFDFSKDNDRKQYLPDLSITGERPIYEDLFNLKDDPTEQHNLAGNPEYAEVLKAYRKCCQELVTELARQVVNVKMRKQINLNYRFLINGEFVETLKLLD